jgi:hypothetical protein
VPDANGETDPPPGRRPAPERGVIVISSRLGKRAVALLAAMGLAGSLAAAVAPVVLASGPDSVATSLGGVFYAPTGETITMTATTTGANTNAATGTWQDKGKSFTYSGKVTKLNVDVVGGVTTAAACGPLNGYGGFIEFVQLVTGPTTSQSYLYPAFYGCPGAPQPGGGLSLTSGTWTALDND